MRNTLVLLALLIPLLGYSQKHKKKISNGAGTMFFSVGYLKSGYSGTNLRLIGSGYDFTLQGAKASDRSSDASFPDQVQPLVNIPQFSLSAGYYYTDFWSVSLTYDRMKYVLDDRNQVRINGAIDPELVDESEWSGIYSGESVVTDRSTFHYENTELNYIRLALTRTDQLWRVGYNNEFVISSNVGLGAGGLISNNDFNFDDKFSRETMSWSGFGVSAHAGLRFEFFRHFFLHTNVGGGIHHQSKVRTRRSDPQSYAKQTYGFSTFDAGIGILLYVRSRNACDGCPIW